MTSLHACRRPCPFSECSTRWSARPSRRYGIRRASSAVQPVPEEPQTNSDGTPAKPKPKLFSHALNENFATDELFEELKDRKSFGRRGELILVAQLVTIALVVFPPMRLVGVVYLVGLLSILSGGIACMFACLCLGRSFSPLVAPRRNNELVTTGMYQYMRHPFYAGLLLLAFGISAVTYSETRLVLAMLLFFVLNAKAKSEELAMKEKHGSEYEEYMQEVARFFPSF